MIIEAAFIALPFMVGVTVSARRAAVIFAGLAAAKASLMLLAVTVLEQPLLAAGITTLCLSLTGFVVGVLLGTWSPSVAKRGSLGVSLVCGALLSAWIGGALQPVIRSEAVETAVVVGTAPEPIWNKVKGFGALAGERPLLMRLGMPTPLRCSLESEAVGARRTCHFDQGRIEQIVTEWDPPVRLGLQIVETDLPVRLFNFTTAAYDLTPKGEGTHVLRTTRFVSKLMPVWFWQPIEQLTVETEHRYLLNELH